MFLPIFYDTISDYIILVILVNHHHPSYGIELNNLFVDVTNEIWFNQFVDTPTRNNRILELVLSTFSNISDFLTTPRMSDHEAVIFCCIINNTVVLLTQNLNWANLDNTYLNFKICFLANNPYSKSVEQNLVDTINGIVTKHVPYRPSSKLPCINRKTKKRYEEMQKIVQHC